MTESTQVRELSMNECWALLRSAPIGRVAVRVDRHVEIFPVTFLVERGTIVFRTATGTKVDAMSVHPDVAFEADGYDGDTGDAWSVVVRAQAGDIDDADALHVLSDGLVPWQSGPKPRIVQLVPSHISGRRFPVSPRASAAPHNRAPSPTGV